MPLTTLQLTTPVPSSVSRGMKVPPGSARRLEAGRKVALGETVTTTAAWSPVSVSRTSSTSVPALAPAVYVPSAAMVPPEASEPPWALNAGGPRWPNTRSLKVVSGATRARVGRTSNAACTSTLMRAEFSQSSAMVMVSVPIVRPAMKRVPESVPTGTSLVIE